MAASMIQYVVVRSDLLHTLKWPTGAVIAQSCHACSAVMHLYHDDPNTIQYVSDLDNMHKVVLDVRAVAYVLNRIIAQYSDTLAATGTALENIRCVKIVILT